MAYIGSPAAPTIATVSDGTVTSAKLDTNIAVDGNLTVDTNTLYVDSTNNRVGIGNSSPAQILEVKQLDQNAFKGIRINNPNAYIGSAGIEFQVDATYCKAAIFQKRNYANGGGDLIFAVDSSSDASNWVEADEKMRIDINGNLKFNSGYGSAATAYGCRAWVNFNGTGTVAIRASGNVSSITDNGTGNYTVNFTIAMPDANYGWEGSARFNTTSEANGILSTRSNDAKTSSTLQVRSFDCAIASTTNPIDSSEINVTVFR